MYLVSIYFDEKTTSRIQGYITQVAKRSGNPFMIEKNVPPHLTISAFETRSEDQVISLFEETRDMFQSGEIIFSGSVFPECAVSFTGFKYLPARTVREGL